MTQRRRWRGSARRSSAAKPTAAWRRSAARSAPIPPRSPPRRSAASPPTTPPACAAASARIPITRWRRLRLVLADGACSTPPIPPASRLSAQSHAALLDGLAALSREITADAVTAARIKREIPAQEHHRLCDQRLGRFRRSGRNSHPSDDRLGRHARLPVAHRLPHRARISTTRPRPWWCSPISPPPAARSARSKARRWTRWSCSTAPRSKASSTRRACRSMSTRSGRKPRRC